MDLPVLIRAIRPEDKRALAEGHERLSPETQRLRFLAPKPRLTTADLRYLTEVDGADHVALVATPVGEPDRIVAVGRWVRERDRPDTAEFAIVVGDEVQGHGIGTRLAVRLADEAREAGIRHFTATILRENRAVRRLLETIAERLEFERHDGEVEELEFALVA